MPIRMLFQKKHFVSLIFLWVLPLSSVGQDGKAKNENIIDVSYGLNYNLKIDKTYSLLPRRGVTHNPRILYRNSNSSRIYETKIQFGIGTLRTVLKRGNIQ